MKFAIVVLLFAGFAAPTAAGIYRWTDEAGVVHYGDRAGTAQRPAERRPDLLAPEVPGNGAPTASIDAATVDAARERARARTKALTVAQDELIEAQLALGAAKQRRERGVEPLAGERLGMAGGGARLGPQYFARQAQLDDAVRQAQANLDGALARRNALR